MLTEENIKKLESQIGKVSGLKKIIKKIQRLTHINMAIDTCEENCLCSYCTGENKLHYGLNIPKNWRYWGWWIIKYGKGKYIRWAIRLLKKPNYDVIKRSKSSGL